MSSGQRYRTGLSASKKSGGALHRGAASTRLHEEEHQSRGPRDDDFEKNTKKKKKKKKNTGRTRTRDWAGYTRTPSSVCNVVVVVVIIIIIIIIPLASLSFSPSSM